MALTQKSRTNLRTNLRQNRTQRADKKRVTRRIASIDLFRIVAIISVVVVHARPFGFAGPDNPKHLLATVIDLSCRFAVPYFFMVSGYFLGERIAAGKSPLRVLAKSVRRLLMLYVGWGVLYLLDPFYLLSDCSLTGWFMAVNQRVTTLPVYDPNFWLEGTQEIMWFLPALIIGLSAVAFAVHCHWQKYLPYVAIALYALGLMWGSYSLLWSGSGTIDFAFNTRNGPFFSPLCVTLGWLISSGQAQGRWRVRTQGAISLICCGLLLQILEAKGLTLLAETTFRSFDYLVGTLSVGLGVLLLALENPNWGEAWPILSWSQYTLGIYLVHNRLINLLEPISRRYNNTVWELLFPLGGYVVSLGLVAAIARLPKMRRWVS
ncbi:MAG: acyltransferase [Cyanobacteria bacterium P01_F01_bin.3]